MYDAITTNYQIRPIRVSIDLICTGVRFPFKAKGGLVQL